MKYFMGVDQDYLLELGLDYRHVVILDWFNKFRGTGEMETAIIKGKEYYWINHTYLAEQLKGLKCQARAMADRLKELVKAGVFISVSSLGNGGRHSFYAINDKVYFRLIAYVPQRINEQNTMYPSNDMDAQNDTHVSDGTHAMYPANDMPCTPTDTCHVSSGIHNCISQDCKDRIEEENIAPTSEAEVKADETAITIPTNTGEEFPISKTQVQDFQETYPAVDVMQELREMRSWSITNKPRRKTSKGMLKFVNTWLAREQDKGRVITTPRRIGNSGWVGTETGRVDL